MPSATPTPTNTPTPTPTPDCCAKAVQDFNWDTSFPTKYSTTQGSGAVTSLEYANGLYAGSWAGSFATRVFSHDPAREDASRHAGWHLYMVAPMGVSHTAAKSLGDAHEVESPNPCSDHYMDLNNNKNGRDMEADLPSGWCLTPGQSVEDAVIPAALSGQLQLTPGC